MTVKFSRCSYVLVLQEMEPVFELEKFGFTRVDDYIMYMLVMYTYEGISFRLNNTKNANKLLDTNFV